MEPHHPPNLEGLRILIVDDEILIASDLQDSFQEAGAEVVGPFSSVRQAVACAKNEDLSAAILDFRVGRDTTVEVAQMLDSRQIPYIFYSGQGVSPELHDQMPDARFLMKPARYGALMRAMQELVGRA